MRSPRLSKHKPFPWVARVDRNDMILMVGSKEVGGGWVRSGTTNKREEIIMVYKSEDCFPSGRLMSHGTVMLRDNLEW